MARSLLSTERDLAAAKNIARGALDLSASEARLAVGTAFARLDKQNRDHFFAWISPLARQKKAIFVTRCPQSWEELGLNGVVDKLEFEPQVDWCSRVLVAYLPLLEAYVSRRAQIERYYLAGSFADALTELDSLDVECGKSFWSLEMRMVLLQDLRGLEAHKAYASEIQLKYPRSPIGYIAGQISQRNEEKTNLRRFVDRVVGRQIPPAMKDLANYLLTKYPPAPERMGGTLNAATNASPIDAYEVLIELISYHRMGPGSNFLGSEHLFRLASLFPIDWRLHRLSIDQDEKHPSYLLPCQPPSLPTPEGLYRLSVEDGAVPFPIGLKPLHRYFELTRSLWSTEETTSSLLAEHEKNIVNHSCVSYFRILGGFYGVDRLNLNERYTFHLDRVGQSIPGTSHLGTLIASPSCEAFPENFDDPWRTECHLLVSLFYGIADDPAVDHALGRISEKLSELWVLRINRLSALAKSRALDFAEAINDVAKFCAGRPDRGYVFPLGDMLPGPRWADVSEYRASIALPIFLSLLQKQSHTEIAEKLLRIAFREFLRSAHVQHPSDLASVASEFGIDNVVYVLREIALTNALDSVESLQNSRALDEERIAIFQKLIELNPEHAGDYTNQIKQLTKLLNLADGLSDIDSSRIHVEAEPLLRAAEERFGETFRRYSELSRASVGVGSAEEFERALRDYLHGGSTTFEQLLDYPQQEGDSLLIEIVTGIVDLFLHDPVHGLDIYLSMRIRHGSLATNLRAPLEARGLHIPEKQTNAISEILENIPASEVRAATTILKEFTKKFEKAITTLLKERIQIKTTAGGNGLFDFSKTALLIASVRSRIEAETTFEMLFDEVFLELALYLAATLKIVRFYIENDFRQEIEKCFDNLRQQLNSAELPTAQPKMIIAASHASPDISATIDMISGWFQIGGTPSGQLRTFDEIVDIALLAVQRAHRSFAPNVSQSIEELGLQSLVTFNYTLDALFPLLENIAEHCGCHNPNVDISVKTTGEYETVGRLITVRVESDVSADIDMDSVLKKLAEIRHLIESGEYKLRVRGEGGTGLLKIHRMVALHDRQTMDFGFTLERRFFAQFTMALQFLSSEKSKELGLI